MPYLHLSLTVAFLLAAAACVVAERKVARFYRDHALIQLSGAFLALALVAFGFWVYSVL